MQTTKSKRLIALCKKKFQVAMNFFKCIENRSFIFYNDWHDDNFSFYVKMLKTPLLRVDLSRFFLNASICTRCSILQNGQHVNEILILKKIQVTGALKNTYVLSNYACYNHNISKF